MLRCNILGNIVNRVDMQTSSDMIKAGFAAVFVGSGGSVELGGAFGAAEKYINRFPDQKEAMVTLMVERALTPDLNLINFSCAIDSIARVDSGSLLKIKDAFVSNDKNAVAYLDSLISQYAPAKK